MEEFEPYYGGDHGDLGNTRAPTQGQQVDEHGEVPHGHERHDVDAQVLNRVGAATAQALDPGLAEVLDDVAVAAQAVDELHTALSEARQEHELARNRLRRLQFSSLATAVELRQPTDETGAAYVEQVKRDLAYTREVVRLDQLRTRVIDMLGAMHYEP